jgi:hypothetical protein
LGRGARAAIRLLSVRGRTAACGFRITGRLRRNDGKALAGPAGVPTFQKAGIKGLVIEPWFGVFVPAGTPAAIVARLNYLLSYANFNGMQIRACRRSTEPAWVAQSGAPPAASSVAMAASIASIWVRWRRSRKRWCFVTRVTIDLQNAAEPREQVRRALALAIFGEHIHHRRRRHPKSVEPDRLWHEFSILVDGQDRQPNPA